MISEGELEDATLVGSENERPQEALDLGEPQN